MKTARFDIRRRPARGFTLLELLVVVAIITLLIGLLLPSIGKARESAKRVKTRAQMKFLGDGLEMFHNENEADPECRATGGFPRSDFRDDPTDTGTQELTGAQWMIRDLFGKDMNGFIPRRNVPPNLIGTPQTWYTATPPIDRAGPYLQADAVSVKAPYNLPGSPVAPPTDPNTPLADADKWAAAAVAVDAFDMPILYYAANVRTASKINACITAFETGGGDPNDPNDVPSGPGIYTYKDNARFTGFILGGTVKDNLEPWDFEGGQHELEYGPASWDDPDAATTIANEIMDQPKSFARQILNRGVYESTAGPNGKHTVLPHRKDSFILWSPGRDKLFGTADDIHNFD